MKRNKTKNYRHYSGGARAESPFSKIGTILLEIIRLLLAAVFIFSGFVKAIDPLGGAYKIEDYLAAFGNPFDKLSLIALPASIALSTFELAVGLCFLLKVKLKTTSALSLVFMGVMLPLTLYIALKNPVTDCGCFGDALIVSNWQTFYKNVVITVFIILLLAFGKKLRPIFTKGMEWALVGVFTLAGVGLSVYSLRHLPMIDFRPYKIGVNIPEAMKIPKGMPSDKYDTKFVYKKDGVTREFTLDNYPKNDSTWVFVEQKSTLVQKGYQPPVHNFNIVDEQGSDITDLLLHRDKVHLLIMYDVNKTSGQGVQRAEELYQIAKVNNEPFYALTASSNSEIDTFKKENGLTFPFCKTDPITLKTIVRSNPGLMTVEKGTITDKRAWRDF